MNPDPQPAADARPLADPEASLQRYMHQRFLDMFIGQSKRAQWGQGAAAVVIALMWLEAQGGLLPIAWLGLALAVQVFRALNTETYLHHINAERSTQRVRWMLLASGLVQALSVLALSTLGEEAQIALTIILMVLSIGAVITTMGYREVFLAYSGPLILALAGENLIDALFMTPDHRLALIGLAVLELVFLAFLRGVGRQQFEIFEQSCRDRFAETQMNLRLQQALGEANEANLAKTQFLAAASHDLRQPIHSMTVLVAALGLRPLDPKTQEIVKLLGNVNQTLSNQLGVLLDLSRLDAGAMKLNLGPHRLDELLQGHLDTLEPVARSRGLTLGVDITAAPTVVTDPVQLLRLVGNLTDNAMKYNRQGGRIDVRLWQEGDQVRLAIRDTGIGIAQEDLDRVFAEFYQVGNVERDRNKGLGLGLSIVKRLGKLLNVRYQLDSKLGEGTTFTLSLAAVDTPPLSASPEAPPEVSLQGLQVLVVDDEAPIREGMRLLLEQLGCSVRVADGTAAALAQLSHAPVDVVLSDLRLREGDDGLKTIAAVQRVRPGVRVAIITGDTHPERLRLVEDAGLTLLHKPISLDTLTDFLRLPRTERGSNP